MTIPADAPSGTYDLEITLVEQRGTHTLTSPRSVSVVQEFSRDPVFVAWGHLDTWGQYQAEYVERLAAIANVLAADMVLVANEGNPAYAAGALYRPLTADRAASAMRAASTPKNLRSAARVSLRPKPSVPSVV